MTIWLLALSLQLFAANSGTLKSIKKITMLMTREKITGYVLGSGNTIPVMMYPKIEPKSATITNAINAKLITPVGVVSKWEILIHSSYCSFLSGPGATLIIFSENWHAFS